MTFHHAFVSCMNLLAANRAADDFSEFAR